METQTITKEPEKEVNGSLTKSEKINLGTTEIARRVRQALKEKYPAFKFSVTTEYYSMGSSIHVSLMESSYRIIKRPQDITEKQLSSLELRGYSIKERLEVQEKRHHQLNPCTLREVHNENWNNGVFLTEEGHYLMQDVVRMFDHYNYDDSDPMTDYFSVNFYLHVNLGKWNKEMKQYEQQESQDAQELNEHFGVTE